MERDLILNPFLRREFEDHLQHWAVMNIMQYVYLFPYSEDRILSLVLAGATLEQLTSTAFGLSHAAILIRMVLAGADQQQDNTVGGLALKSLWSTQHCAHSYSDINAVRNLVNEPFQPHRPLPLFDERMCVPVFEKIELYIKEGHLTGADWKDSNEWKQSILLAMELFETSVKLATTKFVSTTPKFAAPYRLFIRNFPHLVNFILLEPTKEEAKEIEEWLDAGGMMQPDDPLLARTDGTGKNPAKAERNRKKKAKKLAKKANEVNFVEEEAKRVEDSELD
jgi:hypothetical protein